MPTSERLVVPERLNLVLVNPLGAALDHYATSLERTLTDSGAAVSLVTLMEPSTHRQTRWQWMYQYVRSLWNVRRSYPQSESNTIMIQIWPVVGYWDFLLLRLLLGHMRALLVLHDPHPLVRAVGYGRAARWVASRPLVHAAAIVHSETAAQAVRSDTTIRHVDALNHPMLPPERPVSPDSQEVTIRVLGQYKADRDTEGMEQLATEGSANWRYEAIGRGWPPVSGWSVIDRFIDEDEFETYLRDSTVLVIPYVRFFQSGVAIRSLEVGTPVVGPRIPSLIDLLGEDSGWLALEKAWLPAVQAAIQSDPAEIYRVASAAYDKALQQWQAWLVENSSRKTSF